MSEGNRIAELQQKVANFRSAYGRALDDRDKSLEMYEDQLETSRVLGQTVAELHKALTNVKKHIETILPSGYQMSGAWNIANEALKNVEM
jgi:hypothetical protein